MSFIQLDKPRELKLGFGALEFLKTEHGFSTIEEVVAPLAKGDLSLIPAVIEACLIGDNDGLTSVEIRKHLDNYLEANDLEKLLKVLNDVFESSVFMKGVKKKKKQTGKK